MLQKLILISSVTLVLFLFSCDDEGKLNDVKNGNVVNNKNKKESPSLTSSASFTASYVADNIVIYDRFRRSLDPTEYVIELQIMDFDGSATLPIVMSFDGNEYFDDGIGNDLISGDKIYTAEDVNPHNATYPYDSNNLRYSVSNEFITGNNFLYSTELDDTDRGSIVKFICKFNTCSCSSTCYCYGCDLFGGPGCFWLSDCSVEIGL